jgi:hypothetical protein
VLKFSLQLKTVPLSVAMIYLHLQPTEQVTVRHLRKNTANMSNHTARKVS